MVTGVIDTVRALAPLVRQAGREVAAVRHLAHFVRYTWPIIEPGTPLLWNWHIDAVCQELELVQPHGLTKELVINIPPGHMKSLLVSVFWPTWLWLYRPEERQLFFTNDNDLALRDSRRARTIINSDRYKALVARIDRARGVVDGQAYRRLLTWQVGDVTAALNEDPSLKETLAYKLSFRADQNEKKNFENAAGGFRQCLGIGASVTGKRGDGMVIDDPYDAKEVVLGDPKRQAQRMREVVDVYNSVLKSRLNSERDGYRVIIMQRLHHADLAGSRIAAGARAVVLPTCYDPDHPAAYAGDPRTKAGDLLFPARIDLDGDLDNRSALGPRHYAAQHDQNPSPQGGAVFRADHMVHYQGDPQRVALTCRELSISIDCNFKGSKAGSDYVAIGVWGRCEGRSDGIRYVLLDRVKERLSLPDLVARVRYLHRKWQLAGRLRTILVEAKANGDALIQLLKSETGLASLVPYDPKASKYARAEMAAVAFEGHHVGLPDPDHAPWVLDYVEELLAFPAGQHDDQVDMTSQQIIRWTGGETSDPLERLQALRKMTGL